MGRDKTIDIHLIYCSPNQDSNESERRSIDTIADILNTSKNDTILLGDTNMPEICYESYKACPYSGVSIDRSINYINALNNLSYEQFVEEPTLLKILNKNYKEDYNHVPIHDIILANQNNFRQQ